MNIDSTQGGAEPSLASAGSHGDAALWALAWNEDAGRIDPEWVYGTREEATEVNETGCYGRATVTPLYRTPQPTLTDEEREAIEVARRCLLPCHDDFDATLGRLLERMG
jgi:hypothetical protein